MEKMDEKSAKSSDSCVLTRVARFFLVQHTKPGKNIQNKKKVYHIGHKNTKWLQNIQNKNKIDQMLVK
jgi:hypothetical protein